MAFQHSQVRGRRCLLTGPAIQAGSFKNKDNAERARTTLSAIAPVDVAEVDVGGELYYRVRVGPFADEIEAKRRFQGDGAGYQRRQNRDAKLSVAGSAG